MNQKNGVNTEQYYAESTENLWQWIDMAPGEFNVRDITNEFGYKFIYTQKLEKLVKLGFLERVGDKRGQYRKRQMDLEELDFINADDSPVDLWLPLRLSEYAAVMPGNIIIIAGAKDSGKSAFCFNIIKENMRKKWDVHYFSSEMGAGEIKLRLGKDPYLSLDQWKFKAYSRAGEFADVVRPGPRSLNIIDFYESHDDFYKVAGGLKAIHGRLNGGIAIICLQKNPQNDTGLGGYRTLEVCRIALALDKGKAKIVVAKNFKDPEKNPVGWVCNYKLVGGLQIIPTRTHGDQIWQKKEGE